VRKPEHILLQGVVGSHAYGMSHDGSDVDRGGVYAADPLYLLDLNRNTPEEPSYVQNAPHPDMWLHEAKKICRLALNGNPTSTEVMWLDEYEVCSEFGSRLIEIRSSFLSAVRIRYGYLGFATGQLRRFFGYDRETEDGRKHASKNARHLWRLLYQGYRAYLGDGIIVRLPEHAAKDAREFGERAASGEPSLVEHELKRYEMLFDVIKSPLPDVPDNTLAREWLRDLRRSMW
jgi:predicted nucleotidyltransferase